MAPHLVFLYASMFSYMCGAIDAYRKTRCGAVDAYGKTKFGTIDAYRKTRCGAVDTFKKTGCGAIDIFSCPSITRKMKVLLNFQQTYA